MIEIRNVWKRYGDNVILENISSTVKEGEFITLVGASGCGKSTFLRMLLGTDVPSQGEILLDGKPIADEPDAERGEDREQKADDRGDRHQRGAERQREQHERQGQKGIEAVGDRADEYRERTDRRQRRGQCGIDAGLLGRNVQAVRDQRNLVSYPGRDRDQSGDGSSSRVDDVGEFFT